MTFQSGVRVQDVRLDYHNVQYLYNDGDLYYFMDLDTYEQPALSKEIVGDSAPYLKEGLECKLTFYQGQALDIELPLTVDMAGVEAAMSVRGDTATGLTKKVATETGLQVQVAVLGVVVSLCGHGTRHHLSPSLGPPDTPPDQYGPHSADSLNLSRTLKALTRPDERIAISQTILDYVVERNEGVLTSNARDDDRWDAALEAVGRVHCHTAHPVIAHVPLHL